MPVEWPLKDISKADVEISRTATAIRLYFYRQIPLLRQIPYLALEADGRGGWLDSYKSAYRRCIMPIHQENETWGSDDMFLELRSGVLIGAKESTIHYVFAEADILPLDISHEWNLASDLEVFTKLAHQDEEYRFNPAEEIVSMIEKTKQPYHNHPDVLNQALLNKVIYKQELDAMMLALPEINVISVLKAQGFDL